MDSAAESQQVRVNFTTTLPELQLPEGKSQLLVPGDIKRYGLSRVLNSESMLNTDSPIPLDFLVNGTYLRTSLEDYLKDNGLSFETTVTLQYVKSLIPPTYQASFEHDDWVTDIDVLSSTSRAGLWTGSSLPQGQDRLLSASYDGLLRIWNGSGQVIATSPSASNGGHSAAIKSAKFLKSSQIASAGLDRTVRVWKYTETDDFSGELKPTLELFGHQASVESLDVHTPSGRIISASKDGAVGLWSTSKSAAPEVQASLLPGAGSNVAKKRKIAASAPQRGPLSLVQIHNSPASAAIFHPDDSTVAYSASEDHTIKTIDLTTSLVVSSLTTAHPLLSLASLPGISNALLAAGTSARHITLVDPRASATTTSVMTLRGHRNFVTSICASPNDNYSLVSGSHDGTCRIWDLRSVRSGTKTEGGGSVSESVYVIERDSQKGKKKRSDVPGAGCKVFSAVWDKHWGIVSGGEDKQVQINRGSDLLLAKALRFGGSHYFVSGNNANGVRHHDRPIGTVSADPLPLQRGRDAVVSQQRRISSAIPDRPPGFASLRHLAAGPGSLLFLVRHTAARGGRVGDGATAAVARFEPSRLTSRRPAAAGAAAASLLRPTAAAIHRSAANRKRAHCAGRPAHGGVQQAGGGGFLRARRERGSILPPFSSFLAIVCALEVSKLISYRTLSALSVPPYYGEYVLPTYAAVIPIELIPNQPPTAPVVSWRGWHQFLLQKILAEPGQTYVGLTRLFGTFGMPVWFGAGDFPRAADPLAVGKEQRFRAEIYALAQRSLSSGSSGGGMLGGLFGGGGSSSGGGGKMGKMAAHAMLKLATQGSANIVNASLPAGTGFVAPFPGF
ncbi:hypothetical protein JX265_004041 [Neoarthrinium moseri]|uniref:Ribosome biogenesis protein YTM1 n=1 Tax=Neoarthrinium moseri TaxID=1658444 RepID=A0A9Q0AP17_9PEZI|nr:hypothetical protein JX265_004041 [Neoarthrinium moseri]